MQNGVQSRSVPPRKVNLSWLSLGVLLIVVWLLFFDGLATLVRTGSTVQTGATRVANTVIAADAPPTAAVIITSHEIIIPTRVVPGIVIEAVRDQPAPAATATVLPANCVVITWRDGSQGCTNGAEIDATHSQPGYCTIVHGSCTNGQPAGLIEQVDPEVAAEPTPTPWPAKVDVSSGTTWSGWQEADGTSCVAVQFSDGHRQQNCGPKGVKYPAGTLEFIARMIIDGRLGPGGFPRG